jgi:hypothetical protein
LTSSFFPPLSYAPVTASPQYRGPQELGTMLSVTAKPAPGEIFAGWTSNYPLSPTQAASSKLDFILQEAQVLTANFTANPFNVAGANGRYSALIGADDSADRGTLTGRLTKTGLFTGKVRIGRLVLPFKAQFNAQGQLTAPVLIVKKGQVYTIALDLDLTEGGARLLTGTLSGGGIDATVQGERTQFTKGGAAPPQLGSYTILLPPSAENTDTRYPAGIGFGRVTVNKAGAVRLVGRLGDGTMISTSTFISETGFWPLYAQPYGRRGSLSGVVTFDAKSPEHDLSGSVEWVKEAAFDDEGFPQGFSGRSDVIGTRAIAPPAGARRFLHAAPAAPEAALPELSIESPAAFDGRDITVSDPTVEITYRMQSGLFRGEFVEQTSQGAKVRHFSGALLGPKVNLGGGVLVRGDRTGAVILRP